MKFYRLDEMAVGSVTVEILAILLMVVEAREELAAVGVASHQEARSVWHAAFDIMREPQSAKMRVDGRVRKDLNNSGQVASLWDCRPESLG